MVRTKADPPTPAVPAPADSRLRAARRIVEHVAVHLGADLAVKLWDGSIVPLGPTARTDILIAVNTPEVFRSLLLSPRLMTFFELYARGAIAVEGGTPLEAVRRWDHIKAVRLRRNVDKWLVLRSLWPFLRKGGPGAQTVAQGYGGAIVRRHEEGRDDKQLIQFHYDVSNSFYALFLDPEMVYSPAYFARPDMSLEQAQVAKLDRVCRRLRLQPGERLLDIGCGWGALVCHAGRHYGVTALGVTLSQQQYDFAQQKIRALGLQDRVTVELRDFRSVTQPEGFDAVSQIGMFEHLGLDNHDAYFALIHRILKPRGRYLHDAITRRPTRDLRQFRKATAYQQVISRFIFPGGELDYIGMTATNMERHGFEIHEVEALREHYQKTVEIWSERLAANQAAAQADVGAEKTRLWLLYFCLSAMAFERNLAFDFQTLATKRQPGGSGLPMSGFDLQP